MIGCTYLSLSLMLGHMSSFCTAPLLPALAVQVLDDINETNEQMQQIQQVLGQPTGLTSGIDEDELLNELEELEATVRVWRMEDERCLSCWSAGMKGS